MRFSVLIAATVLVLNLSIRTEAQVAFVSTGHYDSTSDARLTTPDVPVRAKSTETVLLVGKITNPAGVLPGAVVILKASKQMAVTNADGEFQFEVPASAGALEAVVTYAGYADEAMTLNAAASESTLNLANARVIVVARRQQLKTYLKTARKQVKRDLKKASK